MLNPLSIIEKYYLPRTPLYSILVNHSEQVRDKALQIAQQKPELQIDATFVAEAAMLHDIGIFMCCAPAIHCFGTHRYVEHGCLGAEILRSEGLSRHALVCERHTGAGITLEMIESRNLPLPHRSLLPVSTEEELICYADKFFSKSHAGQNSIEKIRADLARYGNEQVERFEKWRAMFEY